MTIGYFFVILYNKVGNKVKPTPILLFVNYWEVQTSGMGGVGDLLEDLLRKGVTHVASFVPWQAFETDISHSLTRFLQAAADRRVSVSLVMTPEPGVHYAASGVLKDILKREDSLARSADQSEFLTHTGPQMFALPSISSTEFSKRYYAFLSRFNVFLSDFRRNYPGVNDPEIELVVTGSFWKYYRNPRECCQGVFAGVCGDRSRSAAIAYRHRADECFGQEEFVNDAARWKAQSFDSPQAQWFHQYAEDQFRKRSEEVLSKNTLNLPIRQLELFCPETDPAMTYSNLLQSLASGKADFFRISKILDELASRESSTEDGIALPFVHWASLEGFQTLQESEKQFLILKSLLLFGGRRGGVLLDYREWFGFSPAFRERALHLARNLRDKKLSLRTQGVYLSAHLWSSGGAFWNELYSVLGSTLRMSSAVEKGGVGFLKTEDRPRFVVVDANALVTEGLLRELLEFARLGGLLVLPRSTRYSHGAKILLEQASVHLRNTVQISLGVPYQLGNFSKGRILSYEVNEAGFREERVDRWQNLARAIVALSDIPEVCKLSDSRVNAVSMGRSGGHLAGSPETESLGLFLLNPTPRAVSADLLFNSETGVTDLLAALSSAGAGAPPLELGTRFSLDVPPWGVLPLALECPRHSPSQTGLLSKSMGIATEPERNSERSQQSWN